MLAVLTAVALAAEPAKVDVLDPGAEPRVPLAVAPTPGRVETVGIDMTFTALVVNEGMEMPQQAMPPLHLTLRTEVVSASTGGFRALITVPDVTVGEVSGPGDLQAAVQDAMAPLLSVKGDVTIDPYGVATEASWTSTTGDVDPALVREVERAVELLQVRRPPQPLGVGAQWTVTHTDTDEMGFVVTEIATWTLSAIDDNGWTLDLTTLQKAEVPQPVGANVLEKHVGAAQGQAVLDPEHLHPSSVKLGLTMRTRMKVEGAVTSVTTSGLEAAATRAP